MGISRAFAISMLARGRSFQFGGASPGVGVATTLLLPLPSGETAGYAIQSNLSSFGSYNDSLLNIGFNLGHAISGVPSNQLGFESKYDGGAGFQTETIFSFTSPDGSISRRPYQFSCKYTTGAVDHSFAGRVSFFNSAATSQRILIEDGGNVYIQNGAALILERPNATSSGYLLSAQQVNGTILAQIGYDGGIGVGVAANNQSRISIGGAGDLANIVFFATTPSKTWYLGPSNTYGSGDFILSDQSGRIALRITHTNGRVSMGNSFGSPFPIATKLGVRMEASEHGIVSIGIASQTFDHQEWLDSGNVILSRINKDGYMMTRKTSAPADADLVAGEMALWLDSTNGAAKFKIKAKQANGTVVAGEVALA